MIHIKINKPAMRILSQSHNEIAGFIAFRGEVKLDVCHDRVILTGEHLGGMIMELSVLESGRIHSRQFRMSQGKPIPPTHRIEETLSLAIRGQDLAMHLARLDSDDPVNVDVAKAFIKSAIQSMTCEFISSDEEMI